MPPGPVCPGCAFRNPPDARFCAGCGSALPAPCPACGAALIPGGRFCPGCGQPVAAAPGPPAPAATLSRPEAEARSERRLVTILFADIVGSTSLGEQIDPEDLAELINGAFGVMNQAVADAGGYIARLMGDGLLAFFGAPVSHEDDPLRAIRAALAIRDGVKAYGRKVAADGGPELSVRVGINSGLVLVGQIGSAEFSEYTTMGDAANTAARLQGAAPVGEVVISVETSRLVRGAVDLRPFGPLTLKGKAEPVDAFLLAGPAPAPGASVRGLPGISTPLIGRGAELARLQEAYADAVESGCLHWITLTGDAGVGKSRLTASFLEPLACGPQPPLIVYARTVEQGYDPYALIRRLLEGRYGLDGGPASAEGIVGPVAADLSATPLPEARRAAQDLARLVYPGATAGDDPRGLAERGLAALSALAVSWTAERPLVLALEDLHWADDASLDAVARLAEALSSRPAVILGNARTQLFERRPHWGEGERGHARLDVRSLSTASIGKLVQALLPEAGEALPEAVASFVAERSEGNPYYAEELVEMLLARSVLRKGPDGWAVDPVQLQNVEVPTTLQGVLQARLDALHASERQALQLASVLGRVFWEGALVALGLPPAETSILGGLRGRGLILARERSSFAEEREFVFKHALLCDAAYSTLLRKARPPLHAQAAAWMRDRAGGRYGELAAQVGRHAELAGQPAEAAAHYLAAAARARAGYANADAISLYGRALDLWPPGDPSGAFDCHKGRELALDLLGRRDEQRADLDAMAGLAEGLTNSERSYVHFRRAWLFYRTGDGKMAEVEAHKALELSGENKAARADALVNLGNALNMQNRHAEALDSLSEAISLRDSLGDERGLATALMNAAEANRGLNDLEIAITDNERARAIFEKIDDIRFQAVTTTNLAITHAMLGHLDAAQPQFLQALKLYQAAGDRAGEGIALHNLGFLAGEKGDLDEAERRMREALAIFRSTAQRSDESALLVDLAAVLRRAGRESEAEALDLHVKTLT